jgi:hypothetical protein
MRLGVLMALMAAGCEIDSPPDDWGPNRYEYCAAQVNQLPLSPAEHDQRFRTCLEGRGARTADAGSD